MVERLRHVRFSHNVEFDDDRIEGYVFDEIDAHGDPTGRKTMVAWANADLRFGISVQLDQTPDSVKSPTVFDLYGNPTSADYHGGVATLTVNADPVYLQWVSDGPASSLASITPPLALRSLPAVVPGRTIASQWVVRNRSDQPLDATLTMTTTSTRPVVAKPSEIRVTVDPRSEQVVEIAIEAEPGHAVLPMPKWWHVFTGFDDDLHTIMKELDLSEIPEVVNAGNRTLRPDRVWTETGLINLADVSDGYKEKKPALLFASIDAPQAMTIRVGASADWWMQWWINGKPIFGTLERGNEGPMSVAAHTFDMPLKQGRNVIAVQVLSGSAGFRFLFGGEQEIAVAKSGGIHPDRIEATLSQGNRLLSSQTAALAYQRSLPRYGDLQLDADISQWVRHEPIASLQESSVENFYEALPNQAHWYNGRDDLSADIWARDAGEQIDIVVAVRDDKRGDAETATALSDGDGLKLRITDLDNGDPLDVIVGWMDNKPTIIDAKSGNGVQIFAHHFDQPDRNAGYRYVYRVSVPKQHLPEDAMLLLEVSDSDAEKRKQVARLGRFDDARSGFRLVAGQ